MRDCNICFSAGSVNRWGYCEVCGEDHQEPAHVLWEVHTEVEEGARLRIIQGGSTKLDENVYSSELDQITAS